MTPLTIQSELCPDCENALHQCVCEPVTHPDNPTFQRKTTHRCETCQAEATVHIEATDWHFCESCLKKIDDRIRKMPEPIRRSKPHCHECGGDHEPSGARSDCITHWKRRAVVAENLVSVEKHYPKADTVIIGLQTVSALMRGHTVFAAGVFMIPDSEFTNAAYNFDGVIKYCVRCGDHQKCINNQWPWGDEGALCPDCQEQTGMKTP